jgi:hypothetical protein
LPLAAPVACTEEDPSACNPPDADPGQDPEEQDNEVVAVADSAECPDYRHPPANLIDPRAQKARLIRTHGLGPSCHRSRCPIADDLHCFHWLVDPIACRKLGYVDGVVAQFTGDFGNAHDGDLSVDVCPTVGQGVHDGLNPTREWNELRTPYNFGDFSRGAIHAEVQWCRWYGGPVTVLASADHPSVFFEEFRPVDLGTRLSIVGDWAIDGDAHTEIHEMRIMTSVREDPDDPDAWYLLTSGFFAANSVQQDVLAITVPIPPSRNRALIRTLDCSEVTLAPGDGCLADGITVSVESGADAQGRLACRIELRRNGAKALTDYWCGGGNDLRCPCGDVKKACPTIDFAAQAQAQRCHQLVGNSATGEGNSEIAYAGVARAVWKNTVPTVP